MEVEDGVRVPVLPRDGVGPELLHEEHLVSELGGGTWKKKKVKNHSTNIFGETIGRLHLTKQDVDKMGGRKSKALRRAEKTAAQEEKDAIEADLNREKEEIDDEFEQTHGFSASEP